MTFTRGNVGPSAGLRSGSSWWARPTPVREKFDYQRRSTLIHGERPRQLRNGTSSHTGRGRALGKRDVLRRGKASRKGFPRTRASEAKRASNIRHALARFPTSVELASEATWPLVPRRVGLVRFNGAPTQLLRRSYKPVVHHHYDVRRWGPEGTR